MTGTAFEEFAEAIAAQGPSVSQAPAPDLDHVAILGGGRDARCSRQFAWLRMRR